MELDHRRSYCKAEVAAPAADAQMTEEPLLLMSSKEPLGRSGKIEQQGSEECGGWWLIPFFLGLEALWPALVSLELPKFNTVPHGTLCTP